MSANPSFIPNASCKSTSRSAGVGQAGRVGCLPQPGLTQRQLDCLRFVQGYIEAKGYSPALSEIGVALGMSSRGAAHYILEALERGGFINRLFNRTRAIEILRPVSLPRINGVPLQVVPIHAVPQPQLSTEYKAVK